MKTALVTTTINVPTVLKLYRRLDPDVPFYVAGDRKTPPEAAEFCKSVPDCHYFGPEDQTHWRSSEFIGWNTDSRRNIAVLEALKAGAEVIVSVDDDMVPMGNVFSDFLFEFDYTGLQFGAANRWFDSGVFTTPTAMQRGIPYLEDAAVLQPSFVTDAKVGVIQGTILGVPDTDAATAIIRRPFVHSASDILKHGFVVNPNSFAVFNSQLTFFRRELAPAFAQYYFVQQRNTDILSSLLMRRIMQERDLYTFYGKPLGYHARQPRPLVKDLQAERYGVDTIEAYAGFLQRAPLPARSVVDQCRSLSAGWRGPETEAAMAWYDDCEAVL